MSQTVEVSLPSSTLYVSGTVNGVSVVWTNTTGNTWEAEADRAADDIYMLELSVVDENGGANFLSLVLFYGGLNLVTDRTAADVERWRELKAKGWDQMTADEKAEWMGNPVAAAKNGAVMNLLSLEKVVNAGATAEFSGNKLVVATLTERSFAYVRIILGAAELFEDQTITISCAGVETDEEAAFSIQACWLDSGTDYNFIYGSSMKKPGAVTFDCGKNENGRQYLALFFHAATSVVRPAGATVSYDQVMVELGSTAHPYVPYSSFAATSVMKGMYSYRDMNRVEGAVKLLAERISSLGYLYSPSVKTNWHQEDMPTRADMERYLGNVEGLRSAIPVLSTTPLVPKIYDALDYNKANDLERILLDVERVSKNIPKTWYMAGEIYLGEV